MIPCQLPADCLNEILEYLEENVVTLHSCLLVNRLWCRVSVKILWRNIWDFKCLVAYKRRSAAIFSTLISCLPNESKDLLYENQIFIASTSTSKPPLFNYVSFCKVLSIREICRMTDDVQSVSSSKDRNRLLAKEIIKMFLSQVSSLKKLTYYMDVFNINHQNNISFIHFPEARNSLTDLSELSCGSDIGPTFFPQLAQICHNLRSLTIIFYTPIAIGLEDLISSQNNLRDLTLVQSYQSIDWNKILQSIIKLSNTVKKLHLNGEEDYVPMSFIGLFTNIRELILTFFDKIAFEDFRELQYVNFPNLRIVKIPYECPKVEFLLNFLEINGRNLDELYINNINNTLKLSITKFCPNLKKFFLILNKDDELEILKMIFSGCQYLESIQIWCNLDCLKEKEVSEIIAKYSPKNFYELKLYNESRSLPEDLEFFLSSWKIHKSQKSLSFIIIKNYYEKNCLDNVNEENMKIIEKYKNLGTIKIFGTEQIDMNEEWNFFIH